MTNDINVIINGNKICVPKGTTILAAAQLLDIEIPTLCNHNELPPIGACGVCAVDVIGMDDMPRACETRCIDGMRVETENSRVVAYRKQILSDIMKNHPNDCLTCKKTAGHCRLQEITYLYDINPQERNSSQRGVDESSPAMIRDMDKCIGCKRCVTFCEQIQKIGIYQVIKDSFGHDYVGTKESAPLAKTNCINCGQCVRVCPVGALVEKDGVAKAQWALRNPSLEIVWQMAPAVQNVVGEEFGLPPGQDVTGKIATAMRRLGGKAFHTDFAADVTIMEEGTELIGRLKDGAKLPMITSCCPGWIKFIEHNYPDLLGHVSSCKSPQQMFGALVKSYYAKQNGVNPKQIFHISIMPCVAKKFEIDREEMKNSDWLRDVDLVLTAREFNRLLKRNCIDLANLEDSAFDSLMAGGTGAARIFAATGGVMEAALRTVTHVLTEGNMDALEYEAVRGQDGVKSAQLTVAGTDLRMAVVNGIGSVPPVLEEIAAGKSQYHFIEVMACPGGCVGGGGTPITKNVTPERQAGVYDSDRTNALRRSHENPDVMKLYKDFLGEPCGGLSHQLLHTHYVDRRVK